MHDTTAQTELRRAYLMIEWGRLADALEACSAASQREPDSPLPDTMAGSFLCAYGHHSEALKRLRKASRQAPDFALPHIYFAEASFLMGRPKVAQRSLARAKELDEEGEFDVLIDHLEALFADCDELPQPLVVDP